MEGPVEDDRWSSSISPDLLKSILKRLSCCQTDCFRFGFVCKLWLSILLKNQPLLVPSTPVLLLLPSDEDHTSPNRELLDITTNGIYKLPPLTQTHNQTIFGSSFGWLLYLKYSRPRYSRPRCRPQLLNPLNRAQISLPSATTFANFLDRPGGMRDEIFIDKAVLSSNPTSSTDSDCVVMAIHGSKRVLGFCRIGDKRWTTLGCKWIHFEDVIYIDRLSQFYAVTYTGIVVSWDPSTDPEMVDVAGPPRKHDYYTKKYLVESSGNLLMVRRFMIWDDDGKYKTSKFAIYRLDMDSGKWEKVTNLDDQMMFLGHGDSISVSCHHMSGCKPNCIYFVDDYKDGYSNNGRGCYDMGVYSLDDNSIRPFCFATRFWPSPMAWITPSKESVEGLDIMVQV